MAFASDDALAAARAMRDRGVPLLAVPDNYYDDLEARLELDTAPLAELGCCTTARPTESSCISTSPRSAGACSSRCSSAVAAIAATAP